MSEEKKQTTNTVIKVLVVDDQQIIREGLATILGYLDGITVVGQAANGQEAIEQALALRPDVILMDVRMPLMDGVAATLQICQQLPECRILMLTTFDDEQYVQEALRAGARGYLLKDIPSRDLAQAIRSVYGGIYQIDPAVASRMFANQIQAQPAPATPTTQPTPTKQSTQPTIDLTEREIEILRLVAEGLTNREIAQKLFVTEGTVKNHVSNILSRLGLRDRTQAAIFARENNLL